MERAEIRSRIKTATMKTQLPAVFKKKQADESRPKARNLALGSRRWRKPEPGR
jgi:hypothetical protein